MPAPPWTPTGATRVAAVIGDPVRHSLSPVIHNAALRALDLDWVYVALPVAEGDGAVAVAAVRTLGLEGLSVTMPHKGAVLEAVDRCSPTAARLGAANTVARHGTELHADNTDGRGFLDALRLDEGWEPSGARCAVVGAGGAARAVVLALAEAGASEVVVVNRTPHRGEVAAGLAGAAGRAGSADDLASADLVVNATPLGMRGVATAAAAAPLPVPAGSLRPGQLVVDLVYDPPVTRLLEAARERGAAAVGGIGMLVHQAAHQFRAWTGEDPPLEVMSAAASAALAARRGNSG